MPTTSIVSCAMEIRDRVLQFERELSREFGLELRVKIDQMDNPLMMYGIVRIVGEALKVSIGDLLGVSRIREVSEARQIAIYIVKMLLPKISMVQIGIFFSGRDHTTVIHSIRRVEDFLSIGDEQITAKLNACLLAIEAKKDIPYENDVYQAE